MSVELGKAFVQIVPSARGISGSISNVLSGEADSAGKSAGLGIAGNIKKVIATAGIGAALGKTIKEGAQLEQNLGGTEAVFGKYASNLQNIAKDAYFNMGLSASNYMATANKMASLFQGSGIKQERSLDLTTAAMQRAADVASVMGIDTTFAMESIAGAAKGNFTMMDNLGVAMNATTLEAYALEKGLNFKWNTASNAEKAELAMRMFMERTKQYEGNFARESEETLSGSLGAMKAAAQDFMGNLTLGKDIIPSMQNLVTTASTFLFNNLLPAVGQIIAALPTAIGTAITTGLPIIGQKARDLITSLTDGINNGIPALAAALPGAVNSALQNISASAPTVMAKGAELIRNLGTAIITNAPTLAASAGAAIVSFVKFLEQNLPMIAAKGGEIIGKLAGGIIANLPKIVGAITIIGAFLLKNLARIAVTMIKAGLNVTRGIANGIKSGVASLIGRAMDSIKNKIVEKMTAAKDKVKSILDKIKGFFPLSIGRIFSGMKLPHFNVSGGKAPFGFGGLGTKPSISVSWYRKAEETPYLFSNATLFGAGEGNDEILYGRSALKRDISEAVGNGGVTNITNYITVDGAENPEQFATRFVRQMKLEMRTG